MASLWETSCVKQMELVADLCNLRSSCPSLLQSPAWSVREPRSAPLPLSAGASAAQAGPEQTAETSTV